MSRIFCGKNVMLDCMLSVFSEALDFLKDNLTIVLIAAGALVAVIALIIIIACSVRIHRERARRRAERAAEPEMQTDAVPAAQEEAASAAAVRSVPAAGNVPAGNATATAAKAAPAGVPESPERRAELEKQAELGRVTFIKPRPGMFIRYRYNRSFSAKLIQSEDRVKRYYSELKNCILEYKKVVPRVSWRHESFRYGRPSVAKFVIRGKTLCLCLALNPADYAESKYIVDDMSRYAKFAGTPLLYRIKNDRRCRYAKELIARLFDGAERAEREEEDFSLIPYEETQALVEKGLIRIVSYEELAIPEQSEGEPEKLVEEEFEDDDDFEGEDFEDEDEDELEEVSASDVSSLMADDRAKLRVQQGEGYSDRTRSGVVNIDTLGRFFEEGEKVTLEEIKKRVPYVPKNITYIKVLARGTLSKPLIVVADDFSLEAVKMIVLTGGRAIRNRKKVWLNVKCWGIANQRNPKINLICLRRRKFFVIYAAFPFEYMQSIRLRKLSKFLYPYAIRFNTLMLLFIPSVNAFVYLYLNEFSMGALQLCSAFRQLSNSFIFSLSA